MLALMHSRGSMTTMAGFSRTDERAYDDVVRDVRWGKVSVEGAERDYGVVLGGSPDEPVLDREASDRLRERRRAEAPADAPFFDRGPGYARLSGGVTSAEVDHLR